eukprot:gene56500-56984_t
MVHTSRWQSPAEALAEDGFLHSPSGSQVDWASLEIRELERLLEKPQRLFVVGEGGCGKTMCIFD